MARSIGFRRCLLAFVFFGALIAVGASAQTYPSKPIRLINPWPPGGPADAIARPVMDKVSQALGQPIVIEYKSGANGMIGTQYVAKSATADGYTLLLSHAGPTTISPAVQREMPYEPIKDFEHITLIASPTIVLVVRPELPVRTVPELIAYARANPDKLAYGSVGPGSTTHLAGEMLNMMADLKLLHVPYKGGAPVIQDLIAGQIQLAFVGYAVAAPFIKAGTLRALATASSPNRPSFASDLPTMHETLPGFEINSWYALAAPAGTPKDIVNRLYNEMAKVLRDPQVAAQLRETGSEPGGMPPQEFMAKIKADTALALKVSEAARIAKQ
jgi:tripartite-type tricarboxylate transporter receptor subunit TctC